MTRARLAGHTAAQYTCAPRIFNHCSYEWSDFTDGAVS
jgi:hypothetical protein